MADAPVIVWFSEDLRLGDHPALTAARETDAAVIPVYILDDEAPGDWRMGAASRWWLHHSLKSLAHSFGGAGARLVLRRGPSAPMLERLVEETGAEAVFFSRGYEPWRAALEKDVKARLDARGVACRRYAGRALWDPDRTRTKNDDPYKVYSPFWKAASRNYAPGPRRPRPKKLAAQATWPQSDDLDDWALTPNSPNWAQGWEKFWRPGEAGARAALERFVDEAVDGYKDDRDRPALFATSKLSPHLHFGEISPHDCWRAVDAAIEARGGTAKGGAHFLKELAWREFSVHLLHHFPSFPDEPFRPEFADFPWKEDKAGFAAWTAGLTGYPIVDAGMRELWRTGWMHNRVRMIAASFLIKHLLIPWRDGERWFWDTLVDADLASNSASWQWVAGCGADAAPYFRIFNPVLQGEKFDADGLYVRRWVPEIADLPNAYIHKPWEAPAAVLAEAGVTLSETYPAPIIDHKAARNRALAAFEKIKKQKS